MNQNMELNFEYTLRSVLGKKADHCAGHVHDDTLRNKLYKKFLMKTSKIIRTLETDTQHISRLEENFEEAISIIHDKRRFEHELTTSLLGIIAKLLGFLAVNGRRKRIPLFIICDPEEELSSLGKNSYPSIRKRIIIKLKNEKLSDQKIAQIFNCSASTIAKWRKAT